MIEHTNIKIQFAIVVSGYNNLRVGNHRNIY